MPVIAMINQKGGTGKTTLSTNLASAFAETSPVLLLDADPQGSAQDWADSRLQPMLNLRIQRGEPGRLLEQVRSLAAEYAWVIIDGPPGISRTSADAVRTADLVLIPAKASPYDVWAASDVVAAVQARQESSGGMPRAAFIITMTRARTRLGRQIDQALASTACPHCKRGPRSGCPTPRPPSRVGRCWRAGTRPRGTKYWPYAVKLRGC